MPEFEKEEFKFPDEDTQESKGKPDTELSVKMGTDESSVTFEIEVEDDTPSEDRGREPMPKPIVEELEKDELDQYDESVKVKMKQMRKVWHDERRAKEEAYREQQEAVALAQKLIQENKKYRSLIETGSKEYATTLQNAANLELEIAKRAYKEAYEAGDSDKVLDAQQAMQQANLRVLQAQSFKPPLHEESFDVQNQQAQGQPPVAQPADPKLVAWQKRNPWYGSPRHKGMTAYALGVHEELAEDGVEVGSDEYYANLDKTIRKRFPEYFESTEEIEVSKAKAEPARTKPSTVVAPAVRSTASNKIKLKTSQVALAKKLGLTPEQYALELRKLEAQNG